MILGDLSRQDFACSLPPHLLRLCQKLTQLDLNTLKLGWQDLEEGIRMNIMEFETSASFGKKAEMHRKYADIQLLIKGEEMIEYGLAQPDLNDYDEYRDEEDYQLTEKIPDQNEVVLRPNMFAIFMPYEPHKPGNYINNTPKMLKKLVVKVPLELL